MPLMNLESEQREAASAYVTAGAYVTIGRVRSPHGLEGEVRILILTDNPGRFAPGSRIYVQRRPYVIEQARVNRREAVVKLQHLDSRDQVQRLVGTDVEIPADWVDTLPQDTYYYFQLLDMEVWTTAGEYLGEITEIIETGSNDVYVVHGGLREILVPAIASVIQQVDVEAGRMVVDLPEGL